jgi:exodeoxyribonuclease V alpha subunit
LMRNLLYTAITRARKKVYLIGHHEAFVRAIANNRQDDRNTLFLDRLQKLSSGL